jgi:signal peptidase I
VTRHALVALAALATAAGPPGGPAIRRNLLRLGAHPGDRTFLITAASMEPALHCARPQAGCLARVADRILVRPLAPGRPPRRGDVVAVRTPSGACGLPFRSTFARRIIALPGETVAERTGAILVNGKRLREPYIRPDRRDRRSYPRHRVPAGSFFVLGDNRDFSCDSRDWGFVRRRDVLGRAIGIYWPPARFRRF